MYHLCKCTALWHTRDFVWWREQPIGIQLQNKAWPSLCTCHCSSTCLHLPCMRCIAQCHESCIVHLSRHCRPCMCTASSRTACCLWWCPQQSYTRQKNTSAISDICRSSDMCPRPQCMRYIAQCHEYRNLHLSQHCPPCMCTASLHKRDR